MKIGISTRGLNQGSLAISTIIYNLTRQIIRLASEDHEIILYFNYPDYERLFDPSVKKRSKKINNRLIWDQVWLPAAIKKDQVDIALFMKGTMPILLPCKGAVMFYDLGYFDTELRPYRFLETIYMKRMMALAGEKSSIIYSISEYTKKETVKILGIDGHKIIVCYSGCSPIYRPVTDQENTDTIKSLYQLPSPFMFCPISLSPRKNLSRILNAFDEVKKLVPHHLVITGGQSWGVKKPGKQIKTYFNDRVHFLGTVPHLHMPTLYSMASFTLYPSLIEGFGLPILEAFRCGCPVLTSNITSMPEIAGNAAYLVNPYDQHQIAEGMLKLSTDEGLRVDLTQKGFERSKIFSWENTARTILDGFLR